MERPLLSILVYNSYNNISLLYRVFFLKETIAPLLYTYHSCPLGDVCRCHEDWLKGLRSSPKDGRRLEYTYMKLMPLPHRYYGPIRSGLCRLAQMIASGNPFWRSITSLHTPIAPHCIVLFLLQLRVYLSYMYLQLSLVTVTPHRTLKTHLFGFSGYATIMARFKETSGDF